MMWFSIALMISVIAAPGIPSDIQVNNSTDYPDTSVKLQLPVPSTRGCGEITDYIVTDVSTSTRLHSTFTFNTTIGAVVITVSGLQPETQYSLQVSVKNEAGTASSASASFSVRTQESME